MKWEDNIKMNFREVGFGGGRWMELVDCLVVGFGILLVLTLQVLLPVVS
jgi:hypothetical protein